MGDLLTNGRFIDWTLGLVVLEALAVICWRVLRHDGPALRPFLNNLLSGSFLLIALRNALDGASPLWIWACLAGALVSHIADFIMRLDRPAPSARATFTPLKNPSPIAATLSLRVSRSHLRPVPQEHNDDTSDT